MQKSFIVGPMEDNCGVSSKLLDWARKSDQVVMTGMVEELR